MIGVFWKKCKKHNTVVALKGETCACCVQEQRRYAEFIGATIEPHEWAKIKNETEIKNQQSVLKIKLKDNLRIFYTARKGTIRY